MDSSHVYAIAKALSKKELVALYEKIKKDIEPSFEVPKKQRAILMQEREVFEYLIENCFSKKKV